MLIIIIVTILAITGWGYVLFPWWAGIIIVGTALSLTQI